VNVRGILGLVPAAALLLCPACATVGNDDALLLDVPFRPQRNGYCGTAALQMVLAYYGRPMAAEEIAGQIHLPALGGTIPDLMAEAARKQRLGAAVVRADLAQIEAWIGRGIPVIAFWGPDAGRTNGHFVVLTGFSADRERVRVSGRRPNQWFPLADFLQRWQRGGFSTVVISSAPPPAPPPDAARERHLDELQALLRSPLQGTLSP